MLSSCHCWVVLLVLAEVVPLPMCFLLVVNKQVSDPGGRMQANSTVQYLRSVSK